MGAESWLFANGPHVWNRNSAGTQWRSIRKGWSGWGVTLHGLRHYYASGLIAAGCDVTVQHALGHSSPTITLNIYSYLWPKAEDRTRYAADALMKAATAETADSVRTLAGF
jgi:integrase